jgi:hypothetical protein
MNGQQVLITGFAAGWAPLTQLGLVETAPSPIILLKPTAGHVCPTTMTEAQ